MAGLWIAVSVAIVALGATFLLDLLYPFKVAELQGRVPAASAIAIVECLVLRFEVT